MIRSTLFAKKISKPEDLICDWEKAAKISTLKDITVRLRESPQGKQFVALGLTPFGGLKVLDKETNEEKVLVAEYLW